MQPITASSIDRYVVQVVRDAILNADPAELHKTAQRLQETINEALFDARLQNHLDTSWEDVKTHVRSGTRPPKLPADCDYDNLF